MKQVIDFGKKLTLTAEILEDTANETTNEFNNQRIKLLKNLIELTKSLVDILEYKDEDKFLA